MKIKLKFIQWLLLFLLVPPFALWLMSISGRSSDWVLKPFALMNFALAEMFAFWGGMGALISLGFPFWQILLGISAIFAALAIVNSLLGVIFS